MSTASESMTMYESYLGVFLGIGKASVALRSSRNSELLANLGEAS